MKSRKPQRILVPTDYSDIAGHALRYASGLARQLDASLTVVFSDPFTPPLDFTATTAYYDEQIIGDLRARAEEQLVRHAETNIDPDVLYETAIRVSPALRGILEQAQESEADLIIMGTHGRSGFRRLFLGSVTELVMRRAGVPVLAIPPQSTTSFSIETVICPVLYNVQCREALTFAAQILPHRSRFILIRTAEKENAIHSADELFALRAWVPESIATRCDLRIFGKEHLSEQIASLAKSVHADLIVGAEPDERSADDYLRGSLAERLMRHSGCAVLTMNRPAALREAILTAEHEERPVPEPVGR